MGCVTPDFTATDAMRKLSCLALLVAALPGRAVGRDHVRPAADVPAAWRIDPPKAGDVANTK
jgi:hypothetical protein